MSTPDREQHKEAPIIVVGSLNMDLVMRTPRVPVGGETLTGHEFSTLPGGKGANQAVACARLGAGRLARTVSGKHCATAWLPMASTSGGSDKTPASAPV